MRISNRFRDSVLGTIALLSIIGGGILVAKPVYYLFFSREETAQQQVRTDATSSVIATDLKEPRSIAYIPGGDLLVAERGGTITRITRSGKTAEIEVPRVLVRGEGGLMGLALHPRFLENSWVFLCQTGEDAGRTVNRLVRYTLIENELAEALIILNGVPANDERNSCALGFGPDETLYITTNDAGNAASAQDRRSLSGKVVRLSDIGKIPKDNPLGNMIYSYGHRDPQGLAWDNLGRLWITERGRVEAASGYGELNLVLAGQNYGWPIIEGGQVRSSMVSPALHTGPGDAWTPSGLAYAAGHLWFTSPADEALYAVSVDKEGRVTGVQSYLKGLYGRLRGLTVGDDGMLYATTSNTDEGGKPASGDDRLIRIDPLALLTEQHQEEMPAPEDRGTIKY